MTHTPLPWKVSTQPSGDRAYGIHATGPTGLRANVVNWGGLSRAQSEEGQANAALIVRAVNSHAALVKALEGMVAWHTTGLTPADQIKAFNAARAALAAAAHDTKQQDGGE